MHTHVLLNNAANKTCGWKQSMICKNFLQSIVTCILKRFLDLFVHDRQFSIYHYIKQKYKMFFIFYYPIGFHIKRHFSKSSMFEYKSFIETIYSKWWNWPKWNCPNWGFMQVSYMLFNDKTFIKTSTYM